MKPFAKAIVQSACCGMPNWSSCNNQLLQFFVFFFGFFFFFFRQFTFQGFWGFRISQDQPGEHFTTSEPPQSAPFIHRISTTPRASFRVPLRGTQSATRSKELEIL